MNKKSEKIVPAVLVKTWDDFQKKVQLVRDFVQYVQIDIMDGNFVPNWTFFDAEKIKGAKEDLKYEGHLMVELNDDWIEKCKLAGIDRYIIHYENGAGNLDYFIDKIKKNGGEAGVALNPETKADVLKKFIKRIDTVLIMTVSPGFSGQAMLKENLKKIKLIKSMRPGIIIGVDGGVNEGNISDVKDAGADYVCVNHPIFKNEDKKLIKEKIEFLNGLISVG